MSTSDLKKITTAILMIAATFIAGAAVSEMSAAYADRPSEDSTACDNPTAQQGGPPFFCTSGDPTAVGSDWGTRRSR